MIKIQELPIIKNIIGFSKKRSLPGFKGISIYSILSFVLGEAYDHDIYIRANSVAFSFFLALFPSLIFLFTLIPFIPGSVDFLDVFNESTRDIIPFAAHDYLFEMIGGVVEIERTGLRSVGALLALLFASSGMVTLMTGFDKNYEAFKKRNFLETRLIALWLTILLSSLLLVSFVLIVFGKQFLIFLTDYLGVEPYAGYTLMTFRYIVIFLLFYTGITLIYRLGPTLINRVPYWNPGAIIATVFSILSSMGFAYFVNNFGRYNEIYGSIGALIVIMIWLQINAFIIIVGFELNASIAVHEIDAEIIKEI